MTDNLSMIKVECRANVGINQCLISLLWSTGSPRERYHPFSSLLSFSHKAFFMFFRTQTPLAFLRPTYREPPPSKGVQFSARRDASNHRIASFPFSSILSSDSIDEIYREIREIDLRMIVVPIYLETDREDFYRR